MEMENAQKMDVFAFLVTMEMTVIKCVGLVGMAMGVERGVYVNTGHPVTLSMVVVAVGLDIKEPSVNIDVPMATMVLIAQVCVSVKICVIVTM